MRSYRRKGASPCRPDLVQQLGCPIDALATRQTVRQALAKGTAGTSCKAASTVSFSPTYLRAPCTAASS